MFLVFYLLFFLSNVILWSTFEIKINTKLDCCTTSYLDYKFSTEFSRNVLDYEMGIKRISPLTQIKSTNIGISYLLLNFSSLQLFVSVSLLVLWIFKAPKHWFSYFVHCCPRFLVQIIFPIRFLKIFRVLHALNVFGFYSQLIF